MIIARMLCNHPSVLSGSGYFRAPGFALTCVVILASVLFSNSAFAQAPCPDLTALHVAASADNPDWETIHRQAAVLAPRCLRNADYFALLGAAELNTGRLADALESLERALLLAPDNGGAQIDYAQALFLQGQLFSALALNKQILGRDDLPSTLQPALAARQREWQSMTRQTAYQADLLLGHDSNLNGAPSPDQITLTLSGESVILPLNPEFRPMSGPYVNARVSARFRQLAPEHQHNATVELRGRVSEDKASDLLQLDTRYAFIKPGRERSWQANAGMSHLFFGGSPLYTATELGGRYMPVRESSACQPFAVGAMQPQLFHNQSRQNAIEGKLGAGMTCSFSSSFGAQQLVPEISMLGNEPVRGGRAGGGRSGWQANLDWRLQLPGSATLSSQLNYTKMDDRKGYSPLLSDGAKRWIKRSYVLVQLRRPLGSNTTLLVNAYRQLQQSNLELFRSSDKTLEIGFSHRF